MTTQSYNQLTFGEVVNWLLQNGDNKAASSHYRGIKLDNPSHRRDAEAILTAFVKLRQRDESKITNPAHKAAFNDLEASIVDFCSHAFAAHRSGIKHSLNRDVYRKFQELVSLIRNAYRHFFSYYELTTQVRIKDLYSAGLMVAGAPSASALIKLKTKNFSLKELDKTKSIFEQLVTNKLIKMECIWSNSVTALSRNQRMEFSFAGNPCLVRIEVQAADNLTHDILKACGVTQQEVQDYAQKYQKQFNAYLDSAKAAKKPVYSAVDFFKSVVYNEERDIREKLQQAASEHAFNALMEDPEILQKFKKLSWEAKNQLMKLMDGSLFK